MAEGTEEKEFDESGAGSFVRLQLFVDVDVPLRRSLLLRRLTERIPHTPVHH